MDCILADIGSLTGAGTGSGKSLAVTLILSDAFHRLHWDNRAFNHANAHTWPTVQGAHSTTKPMIAAMA